jgi:CheY-like chemotaxis protein
MLRTLKVTVTEGEPVGQPAAKTPPSPAGLDVLLVEDSLVNQRLAAAVLHKGGHRVTVADNGREALQVLATRSFDVILMDIQMPELDGFEATRRIREQEHLTGRHVPIIAMTAHAMQGDRERCLEGGMDEYISKPIHAQRLLETVAAVAERSALATLQN